MLLSFHIPTRNTTATDYNNAGIRGSFPFTIGLIGEEEEDEDGDLEERYANLVKNGLRKDLIRINPMKKEGDLTNTLEGMRLEADDQGKLSIPLAARDVTLFIDPLDGTRDFTMVRHSNTAFTHKMKPRIKDSDFILC